MKVVITDYEYDTLAPEKEVLERAGLELVAHQCKTEEDVIEACHDADGIISQYAPITARVIDKLDRCKVVARYGIGYDSVDVVAATAKRIAVCNVTDYCIDEVSDHTLALLLATARKVPLLDKHVKGGTWNFNLAKPIRRLRGQVLGLIGFGNIPQQVAEKAAVFGLKVIAYDPFLNAEAAEKLQVESVELEELFVTADFISVHAPLNAQTKHMINSDSLAKMKASAYLLNTARGGLVNEKDLNDALEKEVISGATIDVMEKEPPVADHPLFDSDKAVITPHVAWYSEESEEELKRKSAQNVADVLTGKRPNYIVNPEVMEGRY